MRQGKGKCADSLISKQDPHGRNSETEGVVKHVKVTRIGETVSISINWSAETPSLQVETGPRKQ